jgi:hypothetical protein
MKPANWLLFALLVAAGPLLFLPTPAEPVAWTAPTPPGTDNGPFQRNLALAGMSRSPQTLDIKGPEAITAHPEGGIVTGLLDGRVVRLSADLQKMEKLGHTEGRPLGMAFHPNGQLIIADGKKGLLALNPADGKVSVLATEADGKQIRFADDVVVRADGKHAWFSDASIKWFYHQSTEAVMEHAADGRLLRHDFETGKTVTVLDGLEFANGVAFGPDEAFLLVNETGAYRVRRLWLKGEKAGQNDLFAENLPGLPDNITFHGKDRFWVALFAPRNPLLDGLAAWPGIRKALIRVTPYLPRPVEHRAMAMAFDVDGKLVANLQDDSSGNFSPITSVREIEGTLYFGSLSQPVVGRMAWRP